MRHLKSDLRYGFLSNSFRIMLLLFVAVVMFTGYICGQNAKMNLSSYCRTLEQYQQNGEDTEAALQEDYEILTQDGHSGTIRNPLPYDYEKLSASVYSLSPSYAVMLLFEGMLMFFPILASFFGLIWVSSDLKYKTVRQRALRQGKQKALLTKQLSGLLLLLLLLALMIPVMYGVQAFFCSRFR